MKSTAGRTISSVIKEWETNDAAFRDARAEIAPFMAIARSVVVARARLGLTQEQLASRLGTTKSVVSRIESGRRPTNFVTLQRLADVLRTPLVIVPQSSTVSAPEDGDPLQVDVADEAPYVGLLDQGDLVVGTLEAGADESRVTVAPDPNGRSWLVQGRVVRRSNIFASESTQEQAVGRARRELLLHGGGALQIHRRDGSLREVRRLDQSTASQAKGPEAVG